MKKILLFFIAIISMCLCSCEHMDYADWETSIKYDLICGEDTLHFEDIDTISYHVDFKPIAVVTPDESAIIVRFMNDDGICPDPKYENVYTNGTVLKSKIIYQHSIPKLNSKLELVEFKKRLIRYKKASKFDGREIITDTTNTIPFVPVI